MPNRIRTGKLMRGQMGYVIAGLRDPREARPGEISIATALPIPSVPRLVIPPSRHMCMDLIGHNTLRLRKAEGEV